jgi:hypothetical protein
MHAFLTIWGQRYEKKHNSHSFSVKSGSEYSIICNYFVILEEKAIFLYLKAVPRIEKKLGYE